VIKLRNPKKVPESVKAFLQDVEGFMVSDVRIYND